MKVKVGIQISAKGNFLFLCFVFLTAISCFRILGRMKVKVGIQISAKGNFLFLCFVFLTACLQFY